MFERWKQTNYDMLIKRFKIQKNNMCMHKKDMLS